MGGGQWIYRWIFGVEFNRKQIDAENGGVVLYRPFDWRWPSCFGQIEAMAVIVVVKDGGPTVDRRGVCGVRCGSDSDHVLVYALSLVDGAEVF